MTRETIILAMLVLNIFTCCTENQSKLNSEEDDILSIEKVDFPESAGATVINYCQTDIYQGVLLENQDVDSNRFVLEVEYKGNKQPKSFSLDLTPGKTKITHCSEKHIVIGAACGGPCFGESFIFLKEERPVETYMYCQRTTTDDEIITYIQNEEFKNLIVRNLKNGLEKVVDISQCVEETKYICLADSIYITDQNKLILEYEVSEGVRMNYDVDVEELMNK